jgi:hypothetical protein
MKKFVFYVEPMPDWFANLVTENKVILHKCNFNVQSNDTHCKIVKTGEIVKPGSEIQLLEDGNLLVIVKPYTR